MDRSGESGRFFYRLAVFAVSFVLLLAVSGMALTRRGRAEMDRSDRAFHSGDLRGAIVHSKEAALCYVPGADHVLRAYERLEAVAKGAEARGELGLGRLAWETLRNVHAQTDYPGRPKSAWEAHAEAGLHRIDAAQRARSEQN